MARRMLEPPPTIARTYGIPKSVLDEAYRKNPTHRTEVRQSLEKVRLLCLELGLMTRASSPIWRGLGIA
jgi:hypothetical protein